LTVENTWDTVLTSAALSGKRLQEDATRSRSPACTGLFVGLLFGLENSGDMLLRNAGLSLI
jgi:hypothetical protein